jgi:hypothetical protein
MKHIQLYEQFSGSINVFDNVSKEQAKYIVWLSRQYASKDRRESLVPDVADYLVSEFSWGIKNEVVDVLYNGAKNLFESIMPYHEVVEFLAHGGEADTWDWAHPIAVDMTGNRLKQILPELLPYSNHDIQEGSVPFLHGSQKTGNWWLDHDKTTKDDLTPSQREVYDILDAKYHSVPMFRNVQEILQHLIAEFKTYRPKK